MQVRDDVVDWLLEGDPVIRWQAMRDLSGQSETVWQAERCRTVEAGWGVRFLEHLRPDGTWPSGRWIDTVWTLLTLINCGLPAEYPPLRDAAQRFFDGHLTPERAHDEKWLHQRMDLCHLGFWLRIGAYFVGSDTRLALLAQTAGGTAGCAMIQRRITARFTLHSMCSKACRSRPGPGISRWKRFARARRER
jgi:hypothetical protein